MPTTLDQIRFVLAEAPFGVCVMDGEGTIVYANARFEDNLIINSTPITGKCVYDLIPEVMLDEGVMRRLRSLIDQGSTFSLMVETMSAQRIRASGLINLFGYRLGAYNLLIADLVGGQYDQDNWYTKFIHDIPDAIIIMKHGTLIFSNPAFASMLRRSMDEVLGRQIFDFISPADARTLATLREDEVHELTARIHVPTSSGERILEGRFHAVQDRRGTSIATLRDVTEKVLVEKRLLRQNKDLAVVNMITETLSSSLKMDEILPQTLGKILQILNIETGWIFLLNEQTQILRCTYFYGLPGYVIKSIGDIRVGEGIAGRVAEQGEAIVIENASDDARIRSLAFKKQGIRSFASIPLKSRNRIIGVMNIGSFGQRMISTDDKRLLMTIGVHMGAVIENLLLFQEVAHTSEELKEALAIIEQRNEELKSLVDTVSHDLKNPLIAINGFCKRLRKTAGDRLSPKDLEYIIAIEESGNHMESFITTLLSLSAAEHPNLENVRFPVQAVVDELLREVSPQLDEKGGRIIVEGDLPVITADRTRFMQVFSNLITNAIKYSHPKRRLVIRLSSQTRGNMHIFSVADNGIGIDKEHQDNVFDVFFRGYGTEVDGTGIGLSIAKRAVNVMGGEIWLESERDEGTVFYFSLPAC